MKNLQSIAHHLSPDVLRTQKVSGPNEVCLQNTVELAEQHCQGQRSCCLEHSPSKQSSVGTDVTQQTCIGKCVPLTLTIGLRFYKIWATMLNLSCLIS